MNQNSYLIDSHCHIHNVDDFKSTPEEIIARAHANNVRQMIVIGTSHADSLAARDFANAHNDIYWSYGIHPEYATPSSEEGGSRGGDPKIFRSAARIDFGEENARQDPRSGTTVGPPLGSRGAADAKAVSDKLVAIGEVGLDYHYKPYDRTAQIKLFEEMLALAKKHDLPLIFHIREAFDDFFPIIDNQHIKRAVVHSFSDSKKNLQKVLDHDFYVGVNGLATFASIPLPPLERILLETDAPYLTPVPFRGKINESAYIKCIADYLSTKLGVPLEEIAEKTTENVQTLFHIADPVLRPA